MQLVHQYLLESALRRPVKTAVICDEQSLSYGAFAAQVSMLADQLIVEGLRRGDHVLLLVRDKCDFLISSVAVLQSGGIVIPLGDLSTMEGMHVAGNGWKPAMVITTRDDLREYPFLQDRLSCQFYLLAHDVLPDEPDVSAGQNRDNCYSADSLERIAKLMNLHEQNAALLFGKPKSSAENCILFTHANVMRTTVGMNAHAGYDENNCEFIATAFHDPEGLARAFCVLVAGGTIVVTNDLTDPKRIIDSIMRHNCNALSVGSTMFSAVLNQSNCGLMRISSQLRFIEIDHPNMPLGEKRRLVATFPAANIFVCYGSPEAPRSSILDLRADERKLDTAGRAPGFADITICDETGAAMERGEIGEIAITGEHVAYDVREYDSLSQATGDERGRLRTCDLGWIDAEGYLHVVGRIDESIRMAGQTIAPAQIEKAIRSEFPEYEICLVGLPDPEGIIGEIPVLCYTAGDGKILNPGELSVALGHRLEQYEIPKIVHRVQEFPRDFGIIQRAELRRQLMRKLCRGIEQRLP